MENSRGEARGVPKSSQSKVQIFNYKYFQLNKQLKYSSFKKYFIRLCHSFPFNLGGPRNLSGIRKFSWSSTKQTVSDKKSTLIANKNDKVDNDDNKVKYHYWTYCVGLCIFAIYYRLHWYGPKIYCVHKNLYEKQISQLLSPTDLRLNVLAFGIYVIPAK